jgi:hypothetical protein
MNGRKPDKETTRAGKILRDMHISAHNIKASALCLSLGAYVSLSCIYGPIDAAKVVHDAFMPGTNRKDAELIYARELYEKFSESKNTDNGRPLERQLRSSDLEGELTSDDVTWFTLLNWVEDHEAFFKGSDGAEKKLKKYALW